MQKKTFAVADVKAVDGEHPNGEFEIVMSTDAVDRDGESIIKGAFDPLPASIPVHAFHDFNDPVGRAVPTYDDQGRLVGRGHFASTPRAQEIRQLVADGVINNTSVGFMAAHRSYPDGGVPEVTSAELLEVSFVSVPSNREAAVLAVKGYDEQDPQSNHDLAVAAGAKCAHAAAETTPAPETPSDQDGKSPASNVVEMARMRANIARLSLD